MTPPSFRVFTALALLGISVAGCGGSGGGGGGTRPTGSPEAPPTLIAATVVTAATAPAAGDTLLLIFSEEVTLVSDAIITDEDVALSEGSLGAVTTAPTQQNARTLRVTLGNGVSLPIGTSMTMADAGDAILDLTGNAAVNSDPIVVKRGDGNDPAISVLTLSEVESPLNGSGTAGGTLQVPTTGFTIEVSHDDATSTIDVQATILATSVKVNIDGTTLSAGLNLASALTRTTSGNKTTFTVPADVQFPPGAFDLSVFVLDATGMISAPQTFSALARAADDSVRPFETTVNSSQIWFIDTRRDLESYTLNIFNFVSPLTIAVGPNGRSDLEDLFLSLGLLSSSPIPNVDGAKDSNEVFMDRFRAAVLAELAELFSGANIAFTFDEPGSWSGGTSVPYNSLGFSRIALSGAADTSGATGTLGIAIFDPNNKLQDDNTVTAYGDGERLGVFLHTICNDGVIEHPTTMFRTTFDPFTPARWGLPIGDDASDGSRLMQVTADGRTTAIDQAISRMARFAAVILAHECGHSMGLVMNGAMPVGLFGNDPVAFPVFPSRAADGHIKMPASYFPGFSENIMSPSFDFEAALAPETRFNSLNRAYLRERVLANGQ